MQRSDYAYGRPHRKLRAQLLRRFQDGDPCAECGEPMREWESLHLCHDHLNGGYKGLGHASCNCSEGATRGNELRQPFYQPRHARRW